MKNFCKRMENYNKKQFSIDFSSLPNPENRSQNTKELNITVFQNNTLSPIPYPFHFSKSAFSSIKINNSVQINSYFGI